MIWSKFKKTSNILTEKQLKNLIRKISKNKTFGFAEPAKSKILNHVGKWSDNSTSFLNFTLNNIINNCKYYPDSNNPNKGRVMPTPIPKEKIMAIFYTKPEEGKEYYLIYDFQILKNELKTYNKFASGYWDTNKN